MNGEKTAYPGVRVIHNSDGTDSYYIQYRRGGRDTKLINELAGKSGLNGKGGMSAKKAAEVRIMRMRGVEESNTERRERYKADEGKGVTVAMVWEMYSTQYSDRPSIDRTDKYSFRHFEFLHDKKISELATTDIDALVTRLKKRKSKINTDKFMSPQSIKHAVKLLKRLCKYAASRNICEVPNNIRFEAPKFDNTKTEVLTTDQYKAYMEALDEEPDQDAANVFRIALYTGMRKSAILRLTWDDIDYERGRIRLVAANAKNGEVAHIPMPSTVAALLKEIPKTSNYIFPGKFGGARKSVPRMARRLKREAELPEDFRPMHGLRHNYASQIASSGKVGAAVLQKLMTHKSPQMTARYIDIIDEALQRAGVVADEIFSKS